MDWTYTAAPNGNVVQTGKTALTGRRAARTLTLALGFGTDTRRAADRRARVARARLRRRRTAPTRRGWHAYLAGLKGVPTSAGSDATTYNVSVMTLAAHEDKTYRGGYIASPTMPWVWGTGLENPSGAYHLVWARDLYQIATALAAAGDTAGANRAVDYLFTAPAEGRRLVPAELDGRRHAALGQPAARRGGVPDRARLAARAHRRRAVPRPHQEGRGLPRELSRARRSRRRSAGRTRAATRRGTIAAEIAGLICAADIARQQRRRGVRGAATSGPPTTGRSTSRAGRRRRTGPYAPRPYYLRLTKDGKPNAGTTYNIGDSGPTVDQRKVVDPSFLELVRLGVKPANDPVIRNTVASSTRSSRPATRTVATSGTASTSTATARRRTAANWDIGFPSNPTEDWANNTTIGRNWPIFGGERGEYDLLAGNTARRPHAAGATWPPRRNDGHLIPEQVWAPDFAPAGQPGFPLGEGTFSATPLAWSHAQFVRLAWSIDAGRPVERPSIVAARYGAG